MNECIGHVIGKPHSPVTGLYIGKRIRVAVMPGLHVSPISAAFVVSQLPQSNSILAPSGHSRNVYISVVCMVINFKG